MSVLFILIAFEQMRKHKKAVRNRKRAFRNRKLDGNSETGWLQYVCDNENCLCFKS